MTERVWDRAQDKSRQDLCMALIAGVAVSQWLVCKAWALQRKTQGLHRLMLLQGGPERFTGMHENFMHLFLPKGGDLQIR